MTITVDGLRTALERYETARPTMRKPMQESAVALAIKLTEERDALIERMNKRWAWCDQNEGHPQFIDREEALIADIASYEAIEDELRHAADVLWAAA